MPKSHAWFSKIHILQNKKLERGCYVSRAIYFGYMALSKALRTCDGVPQLSQEFMRRHKYMNTTSSVILADNLGSIHPVSPPWSQAQGLNLFLHLGEPVRGLTLRIKAIRVRIGWQNVFEDQVFRFLLLYDAQPNFNSVTGVTLTPSIGDLISGGPILFNVLDRVNFEMARSRLTTIWDSGILSSCNDSVSTAPTTTATAIGGADLLFMVDLPVELANISSVPQIRMGALWLIALGSAIAPTGMGIQANWEFWYQDAMTGFF